MKISPLVLNVEWARVAIAAQPCAARIHHRRATFDDRSAAKLLSAVDHICQHDVRR